MAPFKSSKGRNVGKQVKSFKSSNIGYVIAERVNAFDATGGTKIPAADSGNGFNYHVFTSSGALQQVDGTAAGTLRVLIVAGGGAGGGRYYAGGGGGGGVVHSSNLTFSGNTEQSVA